MPKDPRTSLTSLNLDGLPGIPRPPITSLDVDELLLKRRPVEPGESTKILPWDQNPAGRLALMAEHVYRLDKYVGTLEVLAGLNEYRRLAAALIAECEEVGLHDVVAEYRKRVERIERCE